MSLRRKRLKWNTISSLLFQTTTIICGFILPRLILGKYGTQVNGLINSITQFLQIIAFLELGIGAVVQSALYKPLADKNCEKTSQIICSAGRFFKKIAIILLFYIFVLVIFYPILVTREFDHLFTGTLILAIGISSFAQYYFGVVDGLLLTADQRGYIQYTAQTVTLILNTAVCALLIKHGTTIHTIKLTTSGIYLIRPLFLRVYVNRHYSINRTIEYSGEPIQQKWNGIAQHVAAVVLDQTDIIVLTVFSTLTNVSIYSVYHFVIYGIKNLFLSLTSGFQSLIGELLAKEEKEELRKIFGWMEWFLHTGTTLVFGCAGVLIIPFVAVYTREITDANYIVPIFAGIITTAHAGHCLRLPYNMLIRAAGHFKETQHNYILASFMNIVISVVTVKVWGLIGVAIGTLCAMVYQTIWMAFYDSKHILLIPIKGFFKHILVDLITAVMAFLLTFNIPLMELSYSAWILLALTDFAIWMAVAMFVNFVFYNEELLQLNKKVFRRVKRIN